MKISLYTPEQCEQIARTAALRYTTDKIPGYHRHKQGKGFTYHDAKGKKITAKHILKRIKTLAIPPGYQKVWICPYENGHIQAIGFDDKNRKQYIYHPLWSEVRQEKKFDLLVQFGKCLPKIRRHVARQLKKPLQLNKEQILCAIIYLLDKAYVRIGTSRYAKENQSYGITTLRKKHFNMGGKKATLDFPGKNAHPWHILLKDKRLIKLLKKCEEIPGYQLFKYYDERGVSHKITSQDVNLYLQLLTNHPFSAKNFRTWVACRETFWCAIKENYSTKALKTTIKDVSVLLGHTPAICRKSYIDPEIIGWWQEGKLINWLINNKISFRSKDKLLILPGKIGHFTKPLLCLQMIQGSDTLALNEAVFDCNKFRYIRTRVF